LNPTNIKKEQLPPSIKNLVEGRAGNKTLENLNGAGPSYGKGNVRKGRLLWVTVEKCTPEPAKIEKWVKHHPHRIYGLRESMNVAILTRQSNIQQNRLLRKGV